MAMFFGVIATHSVDGPASNTRGANKRKQDCDPFVSARKRGGGLPQSPEPSIPNQEWFASAGTELDELFASLTSIPIDDDMSMQAQDDLPQLNVLRCDVMMGSQPVVLPDFIAEFDAYINELLAQASLPVELPDFVLNPEFDALLDELQSQVEPEREMVATIPFVPELCDELFNELSPDFDGIPSSTIDEAFNSIFGDN